jgi:methylmalonyl-CoA mutase
LRCRPSSARIARNTQLIIQEETHITNVIDPWAGSYMMEKLTQDMADAAWKIIEEVEAMGGMTKRRGQRLGQAQDRGRCRREAGPHRLRPDVIVGVNKYKLKTQDAVEARTSTTSSRA